MLASKCNFIDARRRSRAACTMALLAALLGLGACSTATTSTSADVHCPDGGTSCCNGQPCSAGSKCVCQLGEYIECVPATDAEPPNCGDIYCAHNCVAPGVCEPLAALPYCGLK